MVFDKAYFISWKPTAERKDLLQEGVKWARSKNLEPVIIAMEWDNYDRFTNVKWMKVDFQLPPAHARNLALNHFYSTEDDYCIILDDDTWIEVGDDIIDTMRRVDHSDVNVVTVLEHNKQHKLETDAEAHIFRLPEIIASGCFIVKNNRELFFNASIRWMGDTLQYGEDVDFLVKAWYLELGGWEVVTAMTNQSRDREVSGSCWYYPLTGESERNLTQHIGWGLRQTKNRYRVRVHNSKLESELGDVQHFRVRKPK